MNLIEYNEKLKESGMKATDFIRENLTIEEIIEVTNIALDETAKDKSYTNGIKDRMGLVWNSLKSILVSHGVVYDRDKNRVLIPAQFTSEEIEALKLLLECRVVERVESLEKGSESDIDQLSFQIAGAKERGELGVESRNMSFVIDTEVYAMFKKFTKNNPNTTKDIIGLFLLEGMNKYKKE